MRDDRVYRRRLRPTVERRRGAAGFERLEPRIVLCTNVDVLSNSPSIVDEDVGTVSFEVQLNTGNPDRTPCTLTADLQVRLATANTNTSRPATPGEDFVALDETVTIPAGQSSVLVPVQIIDDTGFLEDFETFHLNPEQVINNAAVSPGTMGFVTIRDNEPKATVELFGPLVADENGAGFELTLTTTVPEGVTTQASATVRLGVDTDSTALVPADGGFPDPADPGGLLDEIEVDIPVGISGVFTQQVEYRLVDNQLADGNKTLIVALESISGAVLRFGSAANRTSEVIVRDDETGGNVAPTISRIFDQVATKNGTGTVPFMVVDIETAPDDLGITIVADNATLLPASGIQLTRDGANMMLGLTPAADQVGQTEVAITVTDEGGLTATEMFTLRVFGDPPHIEPIPDQFFETGAQTVTLPFRATDTETGAADLTFFPSSSNEALVPNDSLQVTPIVANPAVSVPPPIHALDVEPTHNLTFSILPGATGVTNIMIIVIDEGLSAFVSFNTFVGAAAPDVSLSVDNTAIEEAGGVATFTATLSAAATSDVTVDLGLSGTATSGTDYAASATQIVIAAGDTSGSVVVTATDDGDDEADETIIVDVISVTGADESGEQQVTTTILDDDGPVVLDNRLSIPRDLTASPGDTIVVPVRITTADLQAGSRLGGVGVALDYDESVLTATSVAPGGFLTENPGWTMVENLGTPGRVVVVGFTSTPVGGVTNDVLVNVTFDVNGNAPAGPTALNLAASSGGAFTELLDENENALALAGPVTDGEDPIDGVITIVGGVPTVRLGVDNFTMKEAGGVATFTATLSAAATSDVTVDLGLSGTATSGTDYTTSATQIVIAAGDTSGSVVARATDDSDDEADETIIVDVIGVTGANESGEQQITVTIADDDGLNEPPVLNDPGTQNFPVTRRTFDVTLVATDPNLGDTLTYTAQVESAEYFLDQTLDLNSNENFFENFGGLGEKWLLGGDDTWYYITPDGDFYRWQGGGVLNREFVATLSPATYADPSLLYDAQPGNLVPVVATLNGNVLTLAPEPGFVSAFSVTAVVSDGERADSRFFLVVQEPNVAPTLTDPGPQTLPTTRNTLDVALEATDPMNDPLTFSARVETAEYYLDQTIGFQLGPGGLFPNWSGSENERWLLGDDGNQWYFITPDGNLYRWLGGDRNIVANRELVATLSPATHADPSLLYDAQAGAAVPSTVSVAGSTLTIDPNSGFVGTFSVLVTVTDIGGATDSTLVRVDVVAAPVANRSVPLNLGGEGERFVTNQTDLQVGGSESSFTDEFNSPGMIDQGKEVQLTDSGSDALGAALDAWLEEDLLYDDISHDLAVDQQQVE